MTTVRIGLPAHLRTLARSPAEVAVDVAADEVTIAAALGALEAAHPALRGTIRDQRTGERRSFMRYFACGTDISLQPQDTPLPPEVVAGTEVLRIVGAIAGG